MRRKTLAFGVTSAPTGAWRGVVPCRASASIPCFSASLRRRIASLVMCGVLAHRLSPMPGADGPARSALPVPLTNPSRMVSGGALREFGSAGSATRLVVAVSIDAISQHCAGRCSSEAKTSATPRQVTNRSGDQDPPIDRVRSEAFAVAVVPPDDHTREPGLPPAPRCLRRREAVRPRVDRHALLRTVLCPAGSNLSAWIQRRRRCPAVIARLGRWHVTGDGANIGFLPRQGASIAGHVHREAHGFTDCCQLTTPTPKGRVVSRDDPVGIEIEPFPCIVGKKESAEERAKLAALSRIDP